MALPGAVGRPREGVLPERLLFSELAQLLGVEDRAPSSA